MSSSNTIIGAPTLILSFRPTFSSVAIAVVRQRTSPDVSALQPPQCVATSPFRQRRPTVIAHDFQLRTPGVRLTSKMSAARINLTDLFFTG
jgi:hypothetical protein